MTSNLAEQHKERMDAVPDEVVAWWNDKFEGLKKANAGMAYSLNHALANYAELNEKYDFLSQRCDDIQEERESLSARVVKIEAYLNEQHQKGNGND